LCKEIAFEDLDESDVEWLMNTSVSTVHQVALFVEATYVIRVPDIYVEGTKLVETF
jgi:hypothetical protein